MSKHPVETRNGSCGYYVVRQLIPVINNFNEKTEQAFWRCPKKNNKKKNNNNNNNNNKMSSDIPSVPDPKKFFYSTYVMTYDDELLR